MSDRVNAYLERDTGRRLFWTLRSRPLKIRLAGIRYGSIELILDILGIDKDALKQLVVDALVFYSPDAFNSAIGGDTPLIAHAYATSEVIETGAARATGRLPLMLTSLLVPLTLALLVCYFAFNAITEEQRGLREERQALRTDQSRNLQTLAEQNAKLSSSLVEGAKSAAVAAKELEQLHLNIIKFRASSLGLLPSDGAATTVSPTSSPRSDVGGPSRQ